MADVLELPLSARRQMKRDLERLRQYNKRLEEVKALYRAHYYTIPIGKIPRPRR